MTEDRTNEQRRNELHEASHAVTAVAIGWEPGPITVIGGRVLSGCAAATPPPVLPFKLALLGEPFVLWPADLRERLERGILLSLAGPLAEEMFAPRLGRAPDTILDAAAERLEELPALTDDEKAWAVAVVDDETGLSDADSIARDIRAAHGPYGESGAALLHYLERQARDLLLLSERKILRIADLLHRLGMLSAAAVIAAIRDEPDRP